MNFRQVNYPTQPFDVPGMTGRTRALIERIGAAYGSLLLLFLSGAIGYLQLVPNSIISAVITGIVIVEFLRRMDVGIPLIQITAILAVLQWLVGPTITFVSELELGRYSMYVPEDTYFQFAIPGTAAFCLGLFLLGSTIRQKFVLGTLDRSYFFTFGLLLNLVAFVSQLAAERAPGGLAFFFHLCTQLKYVGAIYFLLSNHRFRYLFAAASCIQLFTSSAAAGMFHDLIIWLMLISTYWFAQFQMPFARKLLFVGVAAFGVFMIQAIKQDYRDKLRRGIDTSVPQEMWAILSGQRSIVEGEILPLATVRLNQGWIISAVMKHVPEMEPFAEGETVYEAFEASLLPRFLAPDKKKAGGRESFLQYTGLQLGETTSMCISPLGEAYANFGVEGGIGLMLAYGLLFSGIFRFVTNTVVKYPDFAFWVPLIFYQGIKAETEFAVVLNQLVKGAVVAYGGYFGLTRIAYPMIFGREYRVKKGGRA